jgi:hypothetical protein
VAETLGGLRAVPGMRPERLGSKAPETLPGQHETTSGVSQAWPRFSSGGCPNSCFGALTMREVLGRRPGTISLQLTCVTSEVSIDAKAHETV